MKILNRKTTAFIAASILSISGIAFTAAYFANSAKQTNAAPQDVINIPDENLKKAINKSCFNKTDSLDDITEEMALSCTATVYGQGQNISNIEGLQYFTNLNTLWLHSNNITDLAPLRNLTKLITLYLNNNNASDVTQLQNLINLQDLWLHGNNISDIAPLQNLTNLHTLFLSFNNISDLTPLQNLTKLKALYLNGNKISNISLLQNFTELNTLWLHDNNITDLAPLRNLTELSTAYLNGNEIADLNPLTNLTNLTSLWLYGNNISDITPLRNLTNLTNLLLSDNNISDIVPLRNLTNLQEVDLSYNNISDLTPLQDLTRLTNAKLDQYLSLTAQSNIVANPLKNKDGSVIPIVETDFAKNVDANGNPDRNGGYIKLSDDIFRETSVRAVSFDTNSASPNAFKGTLTITYNPPALGKRVVARYETENVTELQSETEVAANNTPVGTDYNHTQPNEITHNNLVYIFKELKQGSAAKVGTVTNAAQTITYVYAPKRGGEVTAKFVDENNKEIKNSVVVSAQNTQVGTEYDASTLKDDEITKNGLKYIFKERKADSADEQGRVEVEGKEVVYIYKKLPVKAEEQNNDENNEVSQLKAPDTGMNFENFIPVITVVLFALSYATFRKIK